MPSVFEEKETIKETLIRSCYDVDMGNFSDHVKVYAEDATVEVINPGMDMVVQGRDGVMAYLNDATKDGLIFRHFTTNHFVQVDGDTARAKTALLLVSRLGDPPSIMTAAIYEDQLIKRDGRWMVKHRRIIGDPAQVSKF